MVQSEKFEFQNSEGLVLAGRLESLENPKCFGIFAHCFTCSKSAKAASRISRELADRGIAVLRFDFTGLGNSEGDFSNTNFSSNVQDIVSAAGALRDRFQAPKLIVGHSLGGTAALLAAGQIPEVAAAASIGSPAEPEHVTHLFGNSVKEIESKGIMEVSLGGRQFQIKKQFLDDVRMVDQKSVLRDLNRPVLIFHSPQDELVEIDQARQIYQMLKHPKNFLAIDGADHMLSDAVDAEYVASMLANWSARYI